jgi:DNA-binding PadR family transcriptional regulator
MKIMRGEITIKVLEAVKDAVVNVADLFDVFLTAGYGASLGKMRYMLAEKERIRDKEELRRKMQQRYYSMLYRLKQQGFIKTSPKKEGVVIRITRIGKEKLSKLLKQSKERLPAPRYLKKEAEQFVIIAFDIPEHSKKKRDWLRAVLKYFGMRMIQKSVWAGKLKLPKEFLDDLRRYNILNCVEIFEISKAGSLQQVG